MFSEEFLEELTWSCEMCKRQRPDRFISVHKVKLVLHDVTFDPRLIFRNIKYCNDNKKCYDEAIKMGEPLGE